MDHSLSIVDEEESSIGDTTSSDLSSALRGPAVAAPSKSNNERKVSGEQQRGMADKESKLVFISKIVVCIVLLTAAGIVAGATFLYTSYQQKSDFEVGFQDFAHQIIEVSQINIHHVFELYESLSLSLTNHAQNNDQHFPYVSYPEFEAQASPIIRGASASFIASIHFVGEEQIGDWEQYALTHQDWVQRGLDYKNMDSAAQSINSFIYHRGPGGLSNVKPAVKKPQDPFLAPMWQFAPVTPSPSFSNYDVFDDLNYRGLLSGILKKKTTIVSGIQVADNTTKLVYERDRIPKTTIASPIYDSNKKQIIAGLLAGTHAWHSFFTQIAPEGMNSITVVISNSCGQVISYEVKGPEVTYLGVGDLHDSRYDSLEIMAEVTGIGSEFTCSSYAFHVYPTTSFEEQFLSHNPILYSCLVIIIFVIAAAVFLVYDRLVEKRQTKVLNTANRSHAIVNSLFPSNVRDRLINGANEDFVMPKDDDGKYNDMLARSIRSLDGASMELGSRPIADLFPHATVMFADIVGFTAWSSVREPSQVFILLETVYNSFDKIAKKMGVFKVETIGDCYVASCGLPDPRSDHALVMAKFARDCLAKMNQVVYKLDSSLGPDTSDLSMRVGLHSGPVTAGVLRGEKSRFQLFGDTVNTAARMESTGEKNRIHLSQETTELLIAAGKSHWIVPRENRVHAKGKGELQTYWLAVGSSAPSIGVSMLGSSATGTPNTRSIAEDSDVGEQLGFEIVPHNNDEKLSRLIDWNVDVLRGLLKKILAMRSESHNQAANALPAWKQRESGTVLDEVCEIITLPSETAVYKQDPDAVMLDPVVVDELTDYVKNIAEMYRPNAFHNFEHASHVTQSVTKLLSRVVKPSTIKSSKKMHMNNDAAQILHQFTFGITSDPITQFACAFSAMIHDVDHTGLPNSQLVKEQREIAMMYNNKSVAEQNSVDLAWELLMEPKYENLRECIYTTKEELTRFRQLVVNSVMATDIVDKELGALRRKRWECAFPHDLEKPEMKESASQEAINRKATIVIEHLIQASDVSHTMQHWHVYIKWNERFFHETYQAYLDGKSEKDPSENWYQGELGFFDFYIIPLAKKLEECGVFGVSSDEYLNYAQANRLEWEKKGKEIVRNYLDRHNSGEWQQENQQ